MVVCPGSQRKDPQSILSYAGIIRAVLYFSCSIQILLDHVASRARRVQPSTTVSKIHTLYPLFACSIYIGRPTVAPWHAECGIGVIFYNCNCIWTNTRAHRPSAASEDSVSRDDRELVHRLPLVILPRIVCAAQGEYLARCILHLYFESGSKGGSQIWSTPHSGVLIASM